MREEVWMERAWLWLQQAGLESVCAHASTCSAPLLKAASWGAAVFGVGSSLQLRRDVGHERATLHRGKRAQVYCEERFAGFNCVHVQEGVSHVMGAVEKLLSTVTAFMHLFNLFQICIVHDTVMMSER